MCQRAPAFFMGNARRRFNGAAAEPLAGKRSAPAPAAKSSAPLKARVRRPRSFQFDLFDGDAAGHPVPIMVGTDEIVGTRALRRQEDVLALARLQHDVGMLAVEGSGIVN